MVLKRVCSFCGGEVEPGTGKMYVRKDGTIFFFCGMKCQKNLLVMRRIPRTVRWTEVYAKAKHGVVEAAAEEEVPTVAAEETPAEEAEATGAYSIIAPKGRDMPQATVDLIDRRLGPELSTATIEKNFLEFTASESLRHALGLWYKKRHPGKKLTEVSTAEYVAFLDTSPAKKILKDWLDAKAKKEKGGE